MLSVSTTALFVSSIAVLTASAHAQMATLPEGQPGAAYHTRKGILFGTASSSVTGRSPALAASVEWASGGDRFRIRARVPVASFRSGNGRRDRHVAEILGAPEHPEILFRTAWLPALPFRSGIARGSVRVPGELEVGGRVADAEFVLRRVTDGGEDAVEARLETAFSTLGVDVPSVAGGLVASVRDPLDLLVRAHLSLVPGGSRLFD